MVHVGQELLIERPETTHEGTKNAARLKPALLELIHTLYRWLRTRKPACEEQKVKKSRRSLHQGGS